MCSMDSLPGAADGLIDALTSRLRESAAGMMLVDEEDDPLVIEAALDAAAARAHTPIRRMRVGRGDGELIVWLRADDERLSDPSFGILGIRLAREQEQVGLS